MSRYVVTIMQKWLINSLTGIYYNSCFFSEIISYIGNIVRDCCQNLHFLLKCQCSIVSKFAYTLFLCYKLVQILTNAKCHAYMISVLRIRVSLVKKTNYLIYNHSLVIQKLRQINDFGHFRDMTFSGHNVTLMLRQTAHSDRFSSHFSTHARLFYILSLLCSSSPASLSVAYPTHVPIIDPIHHPKALCSFSDWGDCEWSHYINNL